MKSGIFFKVSLFLLFILNYNKSLTQDTVIYNLLTENYVNRPNNVHRGQIQVNTGYELSVFNKKFDIEGKVINLAKDGSSGIQHLFPVDIRFGILEHLQISAGINYARTGIRERNVFIIGYDAGISINKLDEYKGPDNLNLGLSFRVPLGLKCIDWTMYGNFLLPVFNPEPDQPNHTINSFEDSGATLSWISYYYRNKFASDILSGVLGTRLKFNTSNFSAAISGNFSTGLTEGKNILWRCNLIEDEFDYYSEEFTYKYGHRIEYNTLFAYQAINWFTVQLFIDGSNTFGGWSNVTGKKVGYRSENLISGGIGYEILASPHLRLFQTIDIPFWGENIIGSMIIHTGISLNFISDTYYNLF